MREVLHPTPEATVRLPEVPEEELHELPEGVTVPDDLSGLEAQGPDSMRRPPRVARWLPWFGLIVLIVGAVVALTALLRDDGAEPVEETATSALVVQGYIDDALAAHRMPMAATSPVTVQGYIDDALFARRVPVTSTSALLVQGYVDAALADARVPVVTESATSALLVQGYVDAALAEARVPVVSESATSALLVQGYVDAALAEARSMS